MNIRRSVTCCTLLLLLAGCGSTNELSPSAKETPPRSSESAPAPATETSSPEPSETPSTAPPLYEPSPADITTVVTVQLAEDPQAPVADDLERLVQAWVRYAMEGAETFPHWESISMAVGGETAVAFDDVAAALSNRDIWKQCPPGRDIYGASSCPVDVLVPSGPPL